MKYRFALAGLVASLSLATSADATVFIVDALAHSSNDGAGVGLSTIALTAGDTLNVTAALDDLWSAGALPRWSNADGLTFDRFATGTDESGQSAGTLIGANFGSLNSAGFSAPFGSLVGQIGVGPGSYRLLGTSFSGPAWATGTLTLLYWDTFTADNTGSVAVNVTTLTPGPTVGLIPEPAAWPLMIAGFGLTGAILRRRRGRPAFA